MVVHVEGPDRTGSPEIRLHDDPLGIHGVEGEEPGPPREQRPARERCRVSPEHRGHEPECRHRQPAHERGGEEPVLGEPVLRLVQCHPVRGRGHDRQHQDHLDPRQAPEYLGGPSRLGIKARGKQEQEGQHQRRHHHQLEESLARVLRQGDSGRPLHPGGAAEQVRKLEGDERGEQEIHQPQRHRNLDRTQPARPRRAGRQDPASGLGQRPVQDRRPHPGRGQGNHHMLGHAFGVEAEGVGKKVPEDRVGGTEQQPEDQQHRRGQQDPADVGGDAPDPAHLPRAPLLVEDGGESTRREPPAQGNKRPHQPHHGEIQQRPRRRRLGRERQEREHHDQPHRVQQQKRLVGAPRPDQRERHRGQQQVPLEPRQA